MRKLLNYTVRFIGAALCISLVFGFASPTLTNAQSSIGLGSSEDNGIRLTINDYSIINHGQDIQLHYTINTNSNIQVSSNTKSLIENPYIWIGNTLVREESESFKKVSKNEYRGTIIAQMHHYRTDNSKMSFHTHGILNQKGQWTVDFMLKSSQY
ncbi:hypothetical protein L1999_00855 [Neobacillus drentensis]|uniref:hypothetical protein n=1 Tax=Neobacillus drentensis TaxID=220684 RepID=UPI001F3B0568|nr:hypothetical protein [Neobacillus drentensis]ULT57220.1 hypothetical protein L1999_00855 [Neobacillus drentensis]